MEMPDLTQKGKGPAPAGINGFAYGVARSIRRTLKQIRRRWRVAGLTREARAILVSYPKAGRTWLRYIIGNYLNEANGLGITVDLNTIFELVPNRDLDRRRGLPAYRFAGSLGIPLVAVTHESYAQVRRPNLPILLMVRDPRDLMVSAYYHHTRHKHRFEGSMAAFLRDPDLGIDDLIRYMNGFADGIDHHRHLVLSYEDLSADPHTHAARVMEFLGLTLDHAALDRAIAASRFEAMRESEMQKGIPGHDYDKSDVNSLRVRKGVVGGYAEELSADDIAFITARCMEKLKPRAVALLERTGFPSHL